MPASDEVSYLKWTGERSERPCTVFKFGWPNSRSSFKEREIWLLSWNIPKNIVPIPKRDKIDAITNHRSRFSV